MSRTGTRNKWESVDVWKKVAPDHKWEATCPECKKTARTGDLLYGWDDVAQTFATYCRTCWESWKILNSLTK